VPFGAVLLAVQQLREQAIADEILQDSPDAKDTIELVNDQCMCLQ